jgi:DMSO/TMAO reductase YedYZ molybdopterin-dependent catalytic subunit
VIIDKPLPPGQVATEEFRRFGLPWFAHRFPTETDRIAIHISGDVAAPFKAIEQLALLPRVEQVSDLHCVTSWSKCSLRWHGIRFRDFYEKLVIPAARPSADATLVVFVGQDGYRNALPLEDLLADDVLLAMSLDGNALTIDHGAPLRLVAPAHYGYKNVKHVHRIEFRRNLSRHRRFPGPGFMSHPRARVALQERGKYLPGWLYRILYRPLIGPTNWAFRVAGAHHNKRKGEK